jgi:hypothetical protein
MISSLSVQAAKNQRFRIAHDMPSEPSRARAAAFCDPASIERL